MDDLILNNDDSYNDDFYNDDSYSAPSLSRPIELDSDSTTTSETIMAVPQSSPVLINSNQAQNEENSQSTRMWKARNYYDLMGEYDEFAKCKVCSNNGKEKMFKHHNSTSNLSRHLRNEHNITDENPDGKVINYIT
jgi:hypothetical protein